jgi:hypothetical protein
MPLTGIPLALALVSVAVVAVPTASAKSRDHRALRIQGVCTQHSTSKLKLSREDRGIELEFQVDQNRNGVPWTVTFSRNGSTLKRFTTTTRAPSGSFEIRRVIAGRLGSDRITAVATRASSETCTADTTAATADPAVASGGARADGTGHDAGDDHGHHSGGHA